jgi:hypothetical protein
MFFTYRSQGPVILRGNWEAKGTPFTPLPVTSSLPKGWEHEEEMDLRTFSHFYDTFQCRRAGKSL